MAVSASFRTFALEQLGRGIRGIRGRSMFGGVGVYAGQRFFALIDDDTLFLKVDDTTRPAFESRGMGPFRPSGDGGETMQYYQVPEDVLEDPTELAVWALKAVEVANRAKVRQSSRKGGRSRS